MKTKDLVDLLLDADPTGELHCCIEFDMKNIDIYRVRSVRGDHGPLREELELSPSGNMRIVGAKFLDLPGKVLLTPHSIESALADDPEMRVSIPKGCDNYSIFVNTWRRISRIMKKPTNE